MAQPNPKTIKPYADLRGANLRGADLYYADLRGADLYYADLRGADLYDADLRGADLRGADLYYADLRGANLYGANLYGANLGNQWIIQGPIRQDGYEFRLTNFRGEGVRVRAGCRNLTPDKAVKHWEATRKGTPLGNETFRILKLLNDLAWERGYFTQENYQRLYNGAEK
jgi:uncharacterized protein YjbI with pentapeptide repeats